MKKIYKDKNVVIIGLGYVGLPLAVLAKEKGYPVTGIVRTEQSANAINKGTPPFEDKELQKRLRRFPISASTDFANVASASIVVLCLPTPVYPNRQPNYEPLMDAVRAMSGFVRKGQLIILESTVNPGVCEEMMIPAIEKGSGLFAGKDFMVAHCPERINPGDPKWNVSNISRVVGGMDRKSLEEAAEFYRSILNAPVTEMQSLKEAEAVKIVENSFRNVNIAFVNELAQSFQKLGINVTRVIKGASTKPFAFMEHYPGCGVGGHCIPVDPYYLIEYAQAQNGFRHRFLRLACEINEDMPQYTVDLLCQALQKIQKNLNSAKVVLLGLSYKPDIDDLRESPALSILDLLRKQQADIEIYDPHIPDRSTVHSLEEALQKADAVVVATAHKMFRDLTPRMLEDSGVEVVIDGRNCLNYESFTNSSVLYQGIGQ
jgi:UDP-N-acetyl-D-glucosamine dehydrogenase